MGHPAGTAGTILRWTVLVLASLPILAACTSTTSTRPDANGIVPLHDHGGGVTAQMAAQRAPTPDLLFMTDAMRDFVDRYVNTLKNPWQRLQVLHQSLRSDALLGIDYDYRADGTAAEVFTRGTANCLSFAHLFVAMARHAGLDASYHLLDLRPQWSRLGAQVVRSQHINVLVRLDHDRHFMIDIEPVDRHHIAESNPIPDVVATALHHNNLAMAHLFEEQLETAYLHAVRALTFGPEIDFLWVNLGAVYARADNHFASADAYRTALQIDPASPSAMNNLMIFHQRRGEAELAQHWAARIRHYRARNPYYHASLGERAAAAGNLQQAVRHFEAAIRRKRNDAELYYQLGRIYGELQRPKQAVKYLQLAVDGAQLAQQRDKYLALLKRIAWPA